MAMNPIPRQMATPRDMRSPRKTYSGGVTSFIFLDYHKTIPHVLTPSTHRGYLQGHCRDMLRLPFDTEY